MCSSSTPSGCSLSDAALRWSFRAKGERPPATLWQPYGLTSAWEFGGKCPNSNLLQRSRGRTTRPLLASARETQRLAETRREFSFSAFLRVPLRLCVKSSQPALLHLQSSILFGCAFVTHVTHVTRLASQPRG